MKFFGWFSRLVMTAVLASSISVITTWALAQAYVTKIVDSYLGNAEVNVQISDILSQILAKKNSMEETDIFTAEEIPDSSTALESRTEPETADGGMPLKENTPESGPESGGQPEDAVPVWNQNGMAGETQEQDILVSAEDLYRMKESLSEEDKMKVFSLLITKLSAENIQHVSQMIEGGVTQDEFGRIIGMIDEALSEEEYDELIKILNKYQ